MFNQWPRSERCEKKIEPSTAFLARTKKVSYCSNIYAFRNAQEKRKEASLKCTNSAPDRLECGSDSERSSLNTPIPSQFPDMNMHESQSKASMDSSTSIVPSLGLKSDDTNENFTYSEGFGPTLSGLRREPDVAYKNWLSGKRFILAQERERRKMEQLKEQKQKEERKRLSEKMYSTWLEKKKIEEAEKEKNIKTPKPQYHNNIPPMSKQEKDARLEIWFLKKRLENERRRQTEYVERIKKCTYENRRRQLSKIAFARWISNAADKPKPVPLNQGILSLRATVSNIYVNPNKWQGNV